ncbi:hypothetical protein QT15_11080 [Pseudoalteromonas flavipulchra NCIMB 2033 = ATCC BAA-314]|nr:hypothetical protein QT15_11080 [Pseudoalteromonas flavipulchra NCIMB 2033 = ATCC BAA-314]MBE0371584.1 hypothetical protein [Pseudoalteromonas flavipulchra NCIMB 2033 = ATCC BAA-314]
MLNSFCRYYLVGATNKRLIINIFLFLFFKKKHNLHSLNDSSSLLFLESKYKRRNDYNELVASFLSYDKSTCLEKVVLTNSFSFIQPFLYITSYLKYIFRSNVKISLKGMTLFLCALKYEDFYSKCDAFFEKNRRLKEVITFCDAHPYLNIIASSAKKHNMLTFTLQHGFYRRVHRTNPNSLAYRNFISDFMYVWDEQSLTALVKCNISANRLIVKNYNNFNQSARISSVANCYGLVLNGPNGFSDNKTLINLAIVLAKRDKKKVLVRLHPNDYLLKYLLLFILKKKYIESITHCDSNSYYKKVSFSFINNSGLIREFNIMNHDYAAVDLNLDREFKLISKRLITIDSIKEKK